MYGICHQHVRDCFLEGSRNISLAVRFPFHLASIDVIKHGRLYPAETEVIGRVLHMGSWKCNGFRVSFFGHLVNLRPARVAKPDCPSHLVKCLSSRVIPCPADDVEFAIVLYPYQMGMASRHHQGKEWRLQILMLDKVRRNMSLNMMDAHQGLFSRVGNRLCLGYAYQKRADKSRTIGHPYRVNIIQGSVGFPERCLYYLVDLLYMLSGSDLRNHSPIQRMQVNLGGYDIRQDFPAIFYDGCRRLITGTFNCQNQYIFFFTHNQSLSSLLPNLY